MSRFDDAPLVEVEDRQTWRAWLEKHHRSASGAWLVTWRAASGRVGLPYEEAIEEALCFGWIDSKGGRLDEMRSRLYFSPRKRGSGWASTNKARVARLIADGRMTPAGLAVIEVAKADGSWSLLDAVERLEVPPDLAEAFDRHPPARSNWDGFPRSVRRVILGWIVQARRPETRAKRIAETAELAARNERANQARGADGAISGLTPRGSDRSTRS